MEARLYGETRMAITQQHQTDLEKRRRVRAQQFLKMYTMRVEPEFRQVVVDGMLKQFDEFGTFQNPVAQATFEGWLLVFKAMPKPSSMKMDPPDTLTLGFLSASSTLDYLALVTGNE
ncbi:hypothetical protein JXVLWARM_CDS_0092 [Burkholderia phage Bm1]